MERGGRICKYSVPTPRLLNPCLLLTCRLYMRGAQHQIDLHDTTFRLSSSSFERTLSGNSSKGYAVNCILPLY